MRYPPAPRLVNYPHPALRRTAEVVTQFDAALRTFTERMFDVMYDAKGVGLAAPQVGVGARLFITDHGTRDGGEPIRRVYINPRMEDASGDEVYEEGCLSFPGIYAKVTRPNRFTLVWQDLTGGELRQTFDVTAGDFLGVVTQHELDHLEGRMFIDHLSTAQLMLIRRKLRELEKDYKAEHGRDGAILRR